MGLIAKMGVYIDMHHDNTGTMIGRPMAVMREAVAMLGDTPSHAARQPA